MWERVDDGYRVLDWEAVEICLDKVRQLRGEDEQALAWEREREVLVLAAMAQAMVMTPPCAVCGTPSARIELVAPGHLPAGWKQWPRTVQDSIGRQRQPGHWYLLFRDVASGNGYGDPIDASRPAGSPVRSALPCTSARSTRPGSTTTPDSARTATPRTATSTGRYPRTATVTAPAATARAWSRTRHEDPPLSRFLRKLPSWRSGDRA
jgi:hypothetical protein